MSPDSSTLRLKAGLCLLLVAVGIPVQAGRIIEVTGVPGTTISSTLSVPAAGGTLRLRTHGLVTPEMGSLRVNSGPWIPLNNAHCVAEGIAAKLNGIGGALDTISFTVPEAALNRGARNTLTFRFNGSAGTETAFRILDLNVVDGAGQPLLPVSDPMQIYVSVIPSVRPASYTQAVVDAQLAQGQNLWKNGIIRDTWSGTTVSAHCSDCHATDGRDLKYFNYSSRSIIERSRFHGLDTASGTAIAAYIETAPTVRVGYPWDPPYQPAPGLDGRPVSNWAAGGGIGAVTDDDQVTLAALFPGGTPSFNFSSTINTRQLPVGIPMPDWNSWLPKVHPLDYWGDSFKPVDAAFKLLRSVPPEQFQVHLANAWATHFNWAATYLHPMGADTETSPAYQIALYSLARWRLVRVWDALQTQGLEDDGKTMFPWPESAERTWPGTGGLAFLAAPHASMTTSQLNGLRDGTETTWFFRSLQWYWLQLVLNDSNHRRNVSSPIDWPYLLAHVAGLWNKGIHAEGMLTAVMAKAGESGTGDPYTPENSFVAFYGPRLGVLFASTDVARWDGHDPAQRDAVVRAFVDEYSRWIHLFGRDYFVNFTGELDPLNIDNTPGVPQSEPWIRSHAGVIQVAEQVGYAPDIIAKLRDLGQFLWPDAVWTAAPAP
jgi:hypothetical protein